LGANDLTYQKRKCSGTWSLCYIFASTLPEAPQQFAALMGVTVLELDEDCGHGDPWCAPDVFANAVNTFINKD